jgi:hypothetical protein
MYVLYFSVDNAHLMCNAHPKLFRHSFDYIWFTSYTFLMYTTHGHFFFFFTNFDLFCIDNAHNARVIYKKYGNNNLLITWLSNAKKKTTQIRHFKEVTYITYWLETDITEQNNFHKMGRSSISISKDLALTLHHLHTPCWPFQSSDYKR